MRLLNRSTLPEISASGIRIGPTDAFPVRVLQFGEGNFLRAFIDWMIQESNRKGLFRTSVQVVQIPEQGMGDLLNAQDGLYTLMLRGVENGKAVESREIITCIKGCLNAVSQWGSVVKAVCSPELEVVFSNTTEAGIEYCPEPYSPGIPQKTFPAKLTALLHARFQAGAPGLLMVPCELIDRNGATLKKYILQYASDWNFGSDFINYVEHECGFLNTLVDRIVAGYPRAEAEAVCDSLGYEDKLIDCGELFHLFVVEGNEKYRTKLPFAETGLHVIWTRDQSPYRTRKVRFLNGGHTGCVPAAYLAGFRYVDEMTRDSLFGKFLRKMLMTEIFPTVSLPDEEKKAFAESIVERFLNPYAHHALISISLNSISKWQVRVLPSLLDYRAFNGTLPPMLTFSFAALLTFYRGKRAADGSWYGSCSGGETYPIKDDPESIAWINRAFAENDCSEAVKMIAGHEVFWGRDLTEIPGFIERVVHDLKSIDGLGMSGAVRKCLGE